VIEPVCRTDPAGELVEERFTFGSAIEEHVAAVLDAATSAYVIQQFQLVACATDDGFGNFKMACKTTDGVLRINYVDNKQQSHLPVRQVRAVRPDLADQSLHIHRQRVDALGFRCDCTQGVGLPDSFGTFYFRIYDRHGDPELARDVTIMSFGSGCSPAAAQHDTGCAEPGYQQCPRLRLGYPSYRRRRHTSTAVTAPAPAAAATKTTATTSHNTAAATRVEGCQPWHIAAHVARRHRKGRDATSAARGK